MGAPYSGGVKRGNFNRRKSCEIKKTGRSGLFFATLKTMNNYAFIDSQNLHLAIKNIGWKLDYAKLRKYLKDKYKIEKAYLFIGYIPGNEGFYQALRDKNYILIFKPTLQSKEGVIKGNCDAELVLQCMIEYTHFDKALIVSGDGDFYCLIEYLLTKNKLLKVGIPNRNKYSALLRKFAKHFFFVSDFRGRLEYNHSKKEASK
jgi:uncharacterized LabA/DUF88 family protein